MFYFIYKKKHTLSGAIIGLITGCVAMTIIMILWNYLITPIYMGYPREAVAEMLVPVFLPFNLIKGGLNASFTFLLYKPVITALRKSGFVESTVKQEKSKHIGLFAIAVLIIVTCVLFILSMRGII